MQTCALKACHRGTLIQKHCNTTHEAVINNTEIQNFVSCLCLYENLD